MMNRIKVLPTDIVNKIAAGEIVVNGAAVVKELIENAIDANSKIISVHIEKGGKQKIEVIDDGEGILQEDIPNAFIRNATSKIDCSIDAVETLGFRGEALSSIAQVSKVLLQSRTEQDELGTRVHLTDNRITDTVELSCNCGTTVEVRDLFYNIPARLKYLKDDSAETSDIIDMVGKIALSHPEISIRLVCDGKEIFHTDGGNNPLRTIGSILGKNASEGLIEINVEDEPLFVHGYVSSPNHISYRHPFHYSIINGRFVTNDAITRGMKSIYHELYGNDEVNFILYIKIPYKMVDVNIHPTKSTVKLSNESLIVMSLNHGVKQISLKNYVLKTLDTTPDKKDDAYRAKSSEAIMQVFETAQEYIPIPIAPQEMKDVDGIMGTESDQTSHFETLFIKNSQSETIIPAEEISYGDKIQKELFHTLSNMKFIGNAFGLYALIEAGDDIYAIDTHAAHERVLYEKYLAEFRKHSISAQTLMVPLVLFFGVKDYHNLLLNLDTFYEMGFEIDDLSQQSVALRSLPHYLTEYDAKSMIESMLEEIAAHTFDSETERNEKLIRAACHNAVRGNEDISAEEVHALLLDLYKTEMPFTCPHGRPVIGKLNMKFFMKAFERIK
jgi:DNA mismatch repair protein MutL